MLVSSLLRPLLLSYASAGNCGDISFPFSYGSSDANTEFLQMSYSQDLEQFIGVGYTSSELLQNGLSSYTKVAIVVIIDDNIET